MAVAALVACWLSLVVDYGLYRLTAAHLPLVPRLLLDAFCLGLADLPAGDLHLLTSRGAHSLLVSTRSDIWHHLRGPRPLDLGARLVFAFGPDFREAIGSYYARLAEAGVIEISRRSSRKEAAMAAPQFNTWAEQVATDTRGRNLTESALTGMYDRMRALGMRPGMFVIDDQWEGTYGNLEHSAERLPGFERFLERVRGDGSRVGLWAAHAALSLVLCMAPRK